MKERTINDFEYRVYYCRPKDTNNDFMWHCTYCNNLEQVKDIVNWCISKDLIIKEIKALIKR